MRLQLALNVDDLDTAIDFYSRMFGAEPAKIRPGYANFAIADPPLKLVLFEGAGPSGSINHLGVETETAEEVTAAESRLSADGVATTGVDETICCYAAKTETWVHAPDGNRWEWYVKTGDTEQLVNTVISGPNAGGMCGAGEACGPEVEVEADPATVGRGDADAPCCAG
ncbi:MAG: ArsI/CadI family heavy metal resistance metalloenzyme [Acidimicrobiales bacterium]